MALAFVQGTGIESVGSVGSLSKAFASNTAAGSLIAVGGVTSGNHLGTGSCADGTNTYTRDSNVSSQAASTQASIFSAPAVAGGAVTVTLTPTISDFVSVGIAEFSGAVTAAPLDAQNTGASAASGSTLATGNVVTDQNTVVVGVVSHGGSTVTITEDATYALIFEDETATNMPINWSYKIVASGTYTGSWTYGAGVANRAGVAAAYKEAAGAASGPWPITTTLGQEPATLMWDWVGVF